MTSINLGFRDVIWYNRPITNCNQYIIMATQDTTIPADNVTREIGEQAAREKAQEAAAKPAKKKKGKE